MARFHHHPDDELAVIDQIDAKVALYVRQVNYLRNHPQMGQAVVEYVRTHPTSHQSVAMAASTVGVDPKAPEAQQLAAKDFKTRVAEDGFGWDDIGSWVGRTIGSFVGFLGRDPKARAELAEAGAHAGSIPGTAADVPAHGIGAVIPQPVRHAAKGAVRAGTTAAEAAFQEAIAAPIRDVIDVAFSGEAPDLLFSPESARQTDFYRERQREIEQFGRDESAGVRAIRELAAGRPVDLGEGFFPGGELQRQANIAAEARKIQYGDRESGVSLGRGLAILVTDPDTVAFDVISGDRKSVV